MSTQSPWKMLGEAGELTNSGKPQDAVKILTELTSQLSSDAQSDQEALHTAYYYLAGAYAHLHKKAEMLTTLKQAIEIQLKKGTRPFTNGPYSVTAKKGEDFTEYYNDPDFLALCPEDVKPPKGTAKLFKDLYDDEPYKALLEAEKIMASKPKDTLTILEAMNYALSSINSDLDEHGESNLIEYGDGKHDIKYFKTYQENIKKQISEAKKAGQSDETFKSVMAWRLQ